MTPMTTEDWNSLKALKGQQNWGDPKRLDRRVVLMLDKFLSQKRLTAVVTSGTQGKHATNSFHYKGMALDFMLPMVPRERLPVLFAELVHAGFGGVGIYADWKLSRNSPPIGGFHVDCREIKDNRVATWMKANSIGKGYLAATAENLKRAFT